MSSPFLSFSSPPPPPPISFCPACPSFSRGQKKKKFTNAERPTEMLAMQTMFLHMYYAAVNNDYY